MYTYDKKTTEPQQTTTKTTAPNISGNFQMDNSTSNSARLDHLKARYAKMRSENSTTNAENDSGGEKLQVAMKTKMQARFPNMNFDDVRVHKNSDKPAELGARAYTKGNQIHIAPGEEDTLEHELGHVVQQKAGIVKATENLYGIMVNTDESKEREADNPSRFATQKNEKCVIVQFKPMKIYFKGKVIYTGQNNISKTLRTTGNGILIVTHKSHPNKYINYLVDYRIKILEDIGVPRQFWDNAVIDGNTHSKNT